MASVRADSACERPRAVASIRPTTSPTRQPTSAPAIPTRTPASAALPTVRATTIAPTWSLGTRPMRPPRVNTTLPIAQPTVPAAPAAGSAARTRPTSRPISAPRRGLSTPRVVELVAPDDRRPATAIGLTPSRRLARRS